jgi:subtilisin family serine protease
LKIMPFIVLMLLVACNATSTKAPEANAAETTGGTDGGGGSGASSTTPGWSFPASSSTVQYAFQDLPYSYTALSGLNGGGWTLTSSAAPPAGLSLAMSGSNAVLSGTPTGSGTTLAGFEITATKAAVTLTARFTLVVRGDLLRPYQWHLQQTLATPYFSDTPGGTANDQDLDVVEAWTEDVLGAGVRIAVSDSGVETTHPDLSANMLAGMHRNYKTGSPANGYLGAPSTLGQAHGTAVAGIIAAVGWNDIGGTGVAPQARVAGFQFVESAQTSSIILHQASGVFDVFNYSYGTGVNADFEDDPLYIAQLRDRVTNGRSGLGQMYVKSAGNEYFGFCHNDDDLGVICPPQNANMPSDNNSPFIITVGATAATPIVASYSNAGSNIWVSAPGGEDGDDAPAIVTTDLASCSQGFSTNTGIWTFNDFETANSSSTFTTFNPQCNYTSTMNGTSSAAPNVTGVIALLLSLDSSLTWRDVKHILAVTADQVAPASTNTDHPEVGLRLPGYVYEQGWVDNAAGFHHHNWYGFGRVNAAAAIAAVLGGYTPLPTAWFETNADFDDAAEGRTGLALAIPDASAAGASSALTINAPTYATDTIVESVQLKVKITHARVGQVGVELTSPSGTKSILLNINNALFVPTEGGTQPDADLDLVLTTHAFYGETALGTWTVKVIDGYDDDVVGTLDEWSLNVLGHIDP